MLKSFFENHLKSASVELKPLHVQKVQVYLNSAAIHCRVVELCCSGQQVVISNSAKTKVSDSDNSKLKYSPFGKTDIEFITRVDLHTNKTRRS